MNIKDCTAIESEDYRRPRQVAFSETCKHIEWKPRGRSHSLFAFCKARKSYIAYCFKNNSPCRSEEV